MRTCLTRPALLAALLLTAACSDDTAKADPFELDDPRADMTSAPDLIAPAPDMDAPDLVAPAPDMDAPDLMPLDMAPVPELTFTALSVGAGHICAITDAGALYCWGRNTSGQVGVGSEADSIPAPTLVPGMERGVTAVSAAGQSTCAIKDDSLYCWGDNTAPLIDGLPEALRSPAPLPTLAGQVQAVSTSGAHTCIIAGPEATLQCWGDDSSGQLAALGEDTRVPNPSAVRVQDVRSVSTGADYTCAVSASGLWCWGANTDKQLLDSEAATTLPAQLLVADSVDSADTMVVGAARRHTCVSREQRLSCWGDDRDGLLGSPAAPTPNNAQNAPILTGVTSFAITERRTCAIVSGGVSCWGDLTHGLPDEPGQPPLRAVTSPQIMPGLERGVSAIATGPSNTCVLMAGLIRCLGDAQYGQLPQASLTPVFIEVR
jgi:hypothetical protein